MKKIYFDFGRINISLRIPDDSHILRMGKAEPLSDPEKNVREALQNPIQCSPLTQMIGRKLQGNPKAEAVVVISDNTRPVPYSGEQGILFPLLDEMIKAGLPPSRITLLVATGTHRAMSAKELRKFLDLRIFSLGLKILNHDCRDSNNLVYIGKAKVGGEILLNRHYKKSDIKILTGLVESHFMAGASGGRKSICPGLIGENSTYVLHSGPILAHPKAADLVLEGNPVHEEALKVARIAGCDMIVNVTLDANYRLTGIFAGDLKKAHLAAVEKLKTYAAIPVSKTYDIVLTHTGFVGVNHYQAAKGALICLPLVKKNGICILASHHSDTDPIGGENYKKMMKLLGEAGEKEYLRKIMDPSWTFIPEQWEAQMWGKLFNLIPTKNLIYCSKEIDKKSYGWLPGTDARTLVPETKNLQELVQGSFDKIVQEFKIREGKNPEIAVLPDGPYGIPVKS
jgi:nickel-dependent lactate racemase